MNNIDTAFKGAAGLTRDYYEALVAASMEPYKIAVNRAKARKDTLTVETAVYTDLGTKLNTFNNSITSLRDVDTSIFKNKVATSGTAGILSASATSSAANGVYDVNVTQLAAAHRVRGDKQTDSTSDLAGIGAGSFTINGVAVSVDADASLGDIRDAINSAVATAVEDETITEEDGFSATIIDHQLVLTANSSGEDYALSIDADADSILQGLGVWTGVAFKNAALQSAQNATFTVNNIEVSRSSNSAIDDVIEGITLNLSNEGETTLTVGPNNSAVTKAVNTFVSALNDLNTWLAAKTGVREGSDGTYIRGSLAGDFSLKSMRRELIQEVFGTWSGAPVNATYNRLDQLGLDLNSELSVSLSDSTKLTDALTNNYDEVFALFEGVLEKVQSTINPYVDGDNNRVDQLKQSADSALEIQSERIKKLESSLSQREETVRDQIAMQFSQINSYNNQGRFLMSTMYGSYNTYG
jgi:flagellar hook-associated protein 2